MGWRVLVGRLLCEYSWETRYRESDWGICKESGKGRVRESLPVQPIRSFLTNAPRLAAGLFTLITKPMNIRKGIKADLPKVLELIKELAEYERSLDQVTNT